MRIYLAAPLFSQVERNWNRILADAVRGQGENWRFVLPQDFRQMDRYNDSKNYPELFKRCTGELMKSDVVLAVLDGADADSGTSFEIGFAYAKGIPVVGLRTDYRPGADHGVNLMCARACTYLVREYSFQEDVELVAKSIARVLKKIESKKGAAAQNG